ncbi:MAG: hypothetical protein QOD88_4476 [Mycobacterium sp.]|nr:hypothetical protein [Mycobacterium sp.]
MVVLGSRGEQVGCEQVRCGGGAGIPAVPIQVLRHVVVVVQVEDISRVDVEAVVLPALDEQPDALPEVVLFGGRQRGKVVER